MKNETIYVEVLKLAVQLIEKGYSVIHEGVEVKMEFTPEHIANTYHTLISELNFPSLSDS